MNKNIFFILAVISYPYLAATGITLKTGNRNSYIGMFKPTDKNLQGLKFGNWGSRPYEYAWVSSLASVEGKRVIDLGVGIPSHYNWYQYVVEQLKPAFYAGVDLDERIKDQLLSGSNFELKYMNMANLEYPDKSFDIAYCISTFEHIPYADFMGSIKEAHRVLTDDGLLIITLDEEWDKNEPSNYYNGWNTLELSLMQRGFTRKNRSFGLPEFMMLIKDYFVLYQDDAMIDSTLGIISSKRDGFIYYQRENRDNSILNSGSVINSCVSYAVLKKK